MGYIPIGPLNGFRLFVVMANISHELASKIFDGSEDAAHDDIALDLCEPEFDLV